MLCPGGGGEGGVGERHFTCLPCFSRHVEELATQPVTQLQGRQARVLCPAAPRTCAAPPFHHYQVIPLARTCSQQERREREREGMRLCYFAVVLLCTCCGPLSCTLVAVCVCVCVCVCVFCCVPMHLYPFPGGRLRVWPGAGGSSGCHQHAVRGTPGRADGGAEAASHTQGTGTAAGRVCPYSAHVCGGGGGGYLVPAQPLHVAL